MLGDIILLHMCTINEDNVIYATDRMFCHLEPFLSLSFEKLNQIPGYIIILYMDTLNDNHMVYGS